MTAQRKKRKTVPAQVEKAVLLKSRRRCCLCYWLLGIDKMDRGQIVHLDQDCSNSEESNLAFLCTDHHDEFDSSTRISKNWTREEVRAWRDQLYLEMRNLYRKDQEARRNQEKFTNLEADLSDLLAEMRMGLKEHPLWRLCTIRDGFDVGASAKFFTYSRKSIPELREKMNVLQGHRLVRKSQNFYTITEALVTYLRSS